jgi:hypothetical protein
MAYRWEASSVGGFVQQLAVSYLRHGYWFYVPGCIPEGKDPAAVDRKLIERYGIAISKHARCARKRQGLANLQYLRHGRFFLLLATYGEHGFFHDEAAVIRDARRQPITFAGYSISHRAGRSCVRIEATEYRVLKGRLVNLAGTPRQVIEREFRQLPYEPYAPIVRQLFAIHRAVNRERSQRGLPPIGPGCVRLRRRIYRPFAGPEPSDGTGGAGYFRRDDWHRRSVRGSRATAGPKRASGGP